MYEFNRIFLIVLDSFGIGEMPDAKNYGDEGSNTLGAIMKSPKFKADNMAKIGLFNIDGANQDNEYSPTHCRYARMTESSADKDTITGHFEMMGVIMKNKMPKYPNGFPKEIIEKLEESTGRKVICNKPYSGTDVIRDYGDEHLETGSLIVYTSADSVCQIAAHESIVPPETLYDYCRKARKIFTGEHSVARIIARPFTGESGNYARTKHRHDFSVAPPHATVLNNLFDSNITTVAIGKINDIFVGDTGKIKSSGGIKKALLSPDNKTGMRLTMETLKDKNFTKGFCFTNLVDFDMLYGHRNDVDGYAAAISDFDAWLPSFQSEMKDTDLLMITGDHGCDPSTVSTDHSREYTPLIMYSNSFKESENLGTRKTFADIGKTIEMNFKINSELPGESLL